MPGLWRRGDPRLSVALLGGLAAAGQAPLSLPWVTLGALALALPLIVAERGRGVIWRAWACGAGYFAAALFWIVSPFLVDAPRHGWMAPFALVFMAGGLALFWGVAGALVAWLHRGRVLALALALTATEALRAVVLTGFPWAEIGHVWIGWPQMQAAAVVGAHGLTLMTLLVAALAVRLIPGVLAGLALVGLVGLWGQMRLPEGAAPARAVTVRLVQPNAPQHLKWRADMIEVFLDRALALTAAPPGPSGPPDLVIWPEMAVVWPLDAAGPVLGRIAGAAGGAWALTGLPRGDARGRYYNALAVLGPDALVRDVYDKHHLVPFGEYMPLAGLFARAGVFGLAADTGYSAGPGPRLIDTGPGGRALPLICYEAIFARDIRRAPRPDWIVHLTNDAWFGDLAGPWQHLAQARLRAVEQGLPLMRAANTGISAGIDPWGRVMAALPLGQAGQIDLALPAPLPPTPYARLGDGPVLGLVLILGLGVLIAGRRPDRDH